MKEKTHDSQKENGLKRELSNEDTSWNVRDFIRESSLIDVQYDSRHALVPGAVPGDPMYDRQIAALDVAQQVLSSVVSGELPNVPKDFALDVHRALTRGLDVFERVGMSGRYRKVDVVIRRLVPIVAFDKKNLQYESGTQYEDIKVAPPNQVSWLMQYRWASDLTRVLRAGATNRAEALSAAFWVHDFFECIHPFIDGNGRSGRILYAATCLALGFDPLVIWYADRNQYYDHINHWRTLHYAQYLTLDHPLDHIGVDHIDVDHIDVDDSAVDRV